MDLLGPVWFGSRPVLESGAASNSSDRGVLGSRSRMLLEVLMVLMCLGAVTGNILVIVLVAATKTFHCVTSVLLINLAVSDLLVGVGVMPFVAMSILNSSWTNCSDLCLYVGYTSSVYCTASVLTLAAIALDRYHSIMDCLRYTSRCTLWRICGVVLWIWLQALATSCPPLLGWSSISYVGPMYSCVVNWANSPGYTALMVALSFLLPAGVILFCYVNIVKVARSHAQRIHSLEDQLHRHRNLPSSLPPTGGSAFHRCRNQHSSSRLVYHLSGRFVSEVHGEGSSGPGEAPVPGSVPSPPSSSPSTRRFLSFLAQSASQQHQQNSQQHHQGVVRLFLVIAAFFLCWTPYIGVAVIQATETALSGQSSLVPPTAVTFSYWLVLLNSDINPLLYALLSKRFQGAMRSLRQKIRSRLGGVQDGMQAQAEGEDRISEPCTQTTQAAQTPTLGPAPESPAHYEATYCSSIFTVNTEFKHHTQDRRSEVFLPGSTSPSHPPWQEPAGGTRSNCLQVPTKTPEGATLPFSALTKETKATFFYGEITVTVEHDVC